VAETALYWDSSAILSVLFSDEHSERARVQALRDGVHLLSSLAWAEVMAVICRLERERAVAPALAETAREALAGGPWRRITSSPDWQALREFAARWPLRGADLWHLALADYLRTELPELVLLTYDRRLAAAARETGFPAT
jgi:predicted nucleic acid-binding protein